MIYFYNLCRPENGVNLTEIKSLYFQFQQVLVLVSAWDDFASIIIQSLIKYLAIKKNEIVYLTLLSHRATKASLLFN